MEFPVNINSAEGINQKHLTEYLITNGLGGYASSTRLNLNMRKYHGLLVAAYNNERYVVLSGIDESVEIDGKIYELGTHHYKKDRNTNLEDIFHPQGFKFFVKSEIEPFPKFYYYIEDKGVAVEKEILMPHGENSVILHYKIKCDMPHNNIKFFLSPLLNMRNFHKNLHLSDLKERFMCEVSENQKHVFVEHKNLRLKFASELNFLKKEYILWNTFYREEKERGYDCFEDLYCPGYFFDIFDGKEKEITIVATTDEIKIEELNYETSRNNEIIRIKNLTNLTSNKEILKQGLKMADKFIIQYSNGYGIIAGYHWFDEWGRDTMLSIPGLCLATGRYEIAGSIIKRWLNFMHKGLIPNFIPVTCPFECPHNSSDASLWLFNAAYFYYIYTKDIKFIEEIHQKLCEIVEGYIKGNSACKMAHDCLIISNPQTTWMDTKWTKREGKAVEINALWYNALSILKFFSKLLNKRFDYVEILGCVKKNFEIFWNKKKQCLYDVISPSDVEDDSIRPNQIFVIGLPFNVIDDERKTKIFNVVFEELYTPCGLRTLSKKDENYKGVYEENEENRDKAYHNGTVWPFLMGGFIDAYLKINNYSRESKQEAMKFLTPLLEYAEKFGTSPEIFDGDYPHTPRGCIAQAWSVAEILRVLDLLNDQC